MNILNYFKFFLLIYFLLIILLIGKNNLFAEEKIRIIADQILFNSENDTVDAIGDAVAISENGSKLKADKILYDEKNNQILAEGNVIFIDNNLNNFFLNSLESNDDLTNMHGNQVRVRLNDGSRITGTKVIKKNEISSMANAEYTPCLEEQYLIKGCPGWKLKSNYIFHDREKKTIYYDHAKLHLFNLPILYLPFFSHPDPSVNKRSGLLMPTVETDNKLGDTLSIPIFYNIKGNQDLTFTPTLQSNSNNFYSLNYRHLNKFGNFEMDSSIDDNSDNMGTRNHIFFNSNIKIDEGKLNIFAQTSNNDTYLRKNKINKLTVLNSGIHFTKTTKDNFFSLESNSYKHLTIQNSEQWEYVYPKIIYNINGIESNFFKGNISLNNEFLQNKDLDESYTTLISSQINLRDSLTHNNSGLIFDNAANLRVVSVSIDRKSHNDDNNIRFYPQISTNISYPLIKSSKNYTQTLSPIIMPIIAPFNNYTGPQVVTGSNLFSSNRASSLTEWESGPRINYGIDYYIDNKDTSSIKATLGQSYRINKNSSSSVEELSDYFLSSTISFNKNNYINNSLVVDRKDIDIKTFNINTYAELDDFKFAIDYDYTSEKYNVAKEQIAIGSEYNFKENFFVKFTGTKDLDTNKNIGYQYGLLYENDCLGIDFNYYRDLTIDRDIEESDGYSFTVVLKPFGSTRSYGKNKVFGPQIK